MTKTFKSANIGMKNTVTIKKNRGNQVHLMAESNRGEVGGCSISRPDAIEAALAILEAAGLENVPHDSANGAEKALGYLIEYVGLERANAKAAADRKALEGEAWALYVPSDGPIVTSEWEDLSDHVQARFLEVARKARTLHGGAQ